MEHDIPHLIEKFWAGQATEAEKQQLAEALGPHEAAWQARLRREYDDQLPPTASLLSEAQSARVLGRLHQQLPGAAPRRRAFGPAWGRWAAAAVLVLGAALGLWRYRAISPPPPVATHAAPPAWQLVSRRNPGPAPLALPLADGSVVTLQAGGAVSYYAPFGRTARNISLTGNALFKVAKDARHPFTVLAGGFTTTALGTKFWVRTATPDRVAVHLLEGKVVVRAAPRSGRTMRERYLRPGQELTVNTRTNQVSVRAWGPNAAARAPLAVVVPPSLPDLAFEKANLPDVFAQVGTRYRVRIAYDSAAVRGLSFSGNFAATDPLPVVLRAVCAVNNLSFTQTPGQVTVRKSP